MECADTSSPAPIANRQNQLLGSLNGITPSGWSEYARAMQDVGAAAIELNIYYLPGDLDVSGSDVEQRHVDVLRRVKTAVTVPVVDPFRAPACSYCPGNRGLEYQPASGSVAVAAAAGTVTFSGVVAGVLDARGRVRSGPGDCFGALCTKARSPYESAPEAGSSDRPRLW